MQHVGLCNVSLEDIQAARAVVEVVSVQNRFNLWEKRDEKNGVLEVIDKFKSYFPVPVCSAASACATYTLIALC